MFMSLSRIFDLMTYEYEIFRAACSILKDLGVLVDLKLYFQIHIDFENYNISILGLLLSVTFRSSSLNRSWGMLRWLGAYIHSC
jgi:hypothetical protein